ncbi:MAG: AMP-binding protein [Candidatus Melainabacteria bacterium]|nr:AMP-binding protein [Candidatus Melainabacteria bacterium]
MENIPCPISQSEELALITTERNWTYAELNRAINGLSIHLQKTAVLPGQRVAFIAHTSVQTIALFFALFRLGAIACPLSYRLPKEQIPHLLDALKCAHFFDPGTLPLDPVDAPEHTIALEQLATFLFTSGSSGTPKIACHTFANHYYSARGALSSLKLNSNSRWQLSLPLFHVGGIGILFRCFLSRAAIVLDSALAPTHISLVPTQLYRQKDSLPKLDCILLGGAPIPSSLLQETKHLPVMTTYGMTEMGSLITLDGIVLPYREVKIVSNEIWVKGKTLFQGYWDAATESVGKIEGWFPTKDLGRFDPEGNLEIIGRKDRQFISGGENIQPEEIEKALLQIPGILQATVLPISDPEYGMRPVAFIEDTTSRHTLHSLREALRPLLPGFKHPARILPYPQQEGMKPSLAALKHILKSL